MFICGKLQHFNYSTVLKNLPKLIINNLSTSNDHHLV